MRSNDLNDGKCGLLLEVDPVAVQLVQYNTPMQLSSFCLEVKQYQME